MDSNKMKVVYTVVERGPNRSYWTKVGVGFVNADGSMNLKLDAVPVNGTLQVRDWEPREERRGDGQGDAGGFNGRAGANAPEARV